MSSLARNAGILIANDGDFFSFINQFYKSFECILRNKCIKRAKEAWEDLEFITLSIEIIKENNVIWHNSVRHHGWRTQAAWTKIFMYYSKKVVIDDNLVNRDKSGEKRTTWVLRDIVNYVMVDWHRTGGEISKQNVDLKMPILDMNVWQEQGIMFQHY